MIGDSLTSDIQGGNNYGIDTCWFNPQQKKNTTAAQPTYEIHKWDEISERNLFKKQLQAIQISK